MSFHQNGMPWQKTIDCFLKLTYSLKMTDILNVENTSHIDINQDSDLAWTMYGQNSGTLKKLMFSKLINLCQELFKRHSTPNSLRIQS